MGTATPSPVGQSRPSSSRTESQASQSEMRPSGSSFLPLPAVKGTLGGISATPNTRGSPLKASYLRKPDTKNETEEKLEEAEELTCSLFQSGGTYSVTTPGGDRFRVDPTLKTCFNVERDGADLVKLWT